jgi:hypothetical protein
MTRLTTIDYGDGVTVELRAEENERSFRDAAAATKRQACRDCGHHSNAHRTGNCTTLVIPADKGWNIANAKKCGCVAMKAQKQKGRAA